MKSNDELKKLIKKIYIYHDIQESPELNEIWINDLIHYSTDLIHSSWNEWRMDENNLRRKPRPPDLIKIIKKKIINSRPLGINQKDKKEPLIKGRSIADDEIIKRMEKMKINNPNLLEELKKCKTVKEKMLICFSANEEDISNNKLINDIIKKISKLMD
ncbi:MAG: hypothetical protein ACFFD1_07115 [Candidatus Thorarchaeota archaeon]